MERKKREGYDSSESSIIEQLALNKLDNDEFNFSIKDIESL